MAVAVGMGMVVVLGSCVDDSGAIAVTVKVGRFVTVGGAGEGLLVCKGAIAACGEALGVGADTELLNAMSLAVLPLEMSHQTPPPMAKVSSKTSSRGSMAKIGLLFLALRAEGVAFTGGEGMFSLMSPT